MEMIIPVESTAPIKTVERFAADEIGHWFEVCDQFLKWERAHMLLDDPSPETAKQHRAVLTLLLRFIRAMHQEAQAAGIDPGTVSAVALRLRKLQGSWTMFYNPMHESEAEAIQKQCFPDER